MIPIHQFEQCVRTVSASALTPDVKERRLRDVERAINHYLLRIEAQERAKEPTLPPGITAAKEQLRQLATEASYLAKVYHRQIAA